jgi:hypothetical protein
VIISQLHALFLRFHNRIAKDMNDGQVGDVQNQVRWHYQWVVLYDFLPRVIDEKTYNSILPHVNAKSDPDTHPPRTPTYQPKNGPFIPVEFSDAAYRFGHSMIRGEYHLNSGGPSVGGPFAIMGADLRTTLVGLRAFPDTWAIDWELFFEGLSTHPNQKPQMALKIDTFLAAPLANLPQGVITGKPVSLAQRDLVHGSKTQLPSGQEVAELMNAKLPDNEKIRVLDDSELFQGREAIANSFAGKAPLWYYVLAEAEHRNDGEKLGPLGGRLVMETIVGLMVADQNSILGKQSAFRPSYLNQESKFGMTELITVATGGTVTRAARA